VKVVRTMLGHITATTTLDTYGHLFPDQLDDVAEKTSARRTAALREAACSVSSETIRSESDSGAGNNERGPP